MGRHRPVGREQTLSEKELHMKMNPTSKRGIRWAVLILVTCSWLSMGALDSCDPTIATQILTGVGNATADVASVLIKAIFAQLAPDQQTPVTTTTMLDHWSVD